MQMHHDTGLVGLVQNPGEHPAPRLLIDFHLNRRMIHSFSREAVIAAKAAHQLRRCPPTPVIEPGLMDADHPVNSTLPDNAGGTTISCCYLHRL